MLRRLLVLFCVLVLATPVWATDDGGSADSCRECGSAAYRVLKACLAGGGEEATCKAASQQTFAACLGACEVVEVSCESRCTARAYAAKEECFGGEGVTNESGPDDGEHDECHEVFDEVKDECLEDECHEPEPGCTEEHCDDDQPACPGRCAQSVQAARERCVADGVSPDRCAARVATMIRHCIAAHCEEGDDEDEPTCESRCEEHAQAEAARCEAAGGDATTCQAAAEAGFASCVAMHCEVSEGCARRCARRGAKVERKCLKRGGDAATCAAAAGDAITACEDDHCAPPPPACCGDECEEQAEAMRAACEADGGEAAVCQDMAAGAREECLAACATSPDATCDEVCENDAEALLGAMMGRGGAEERVLRRVHRSYRKCEGRCP